MAITLSFFTVGGAPASSEEEAGGAGEGDLDLDKDLDLDLLLERPRTIEERLAATVAATEAEEKRGL